MAPVAKAADSISNAIAHAIKDVLYQGMGAKLLGFSPSRVYWHYVEEYVTAAQADHAAIGILGGDYTVVLETLRGVDGSGNFVGVLQQRAYNFDVVVFKKGRNRQELLEERRRWTDAVNACLSEKPRLTGDALVARVEEGQSVEPFQSGSVMFTAASVKVSVNAFPVQGAVTF